MREIPIFDSIDNCPHVPNADPTYQESALFVWHDTDAGVGSFLRLSQEPNVPAINCCFGVFTADGLRFRANVTGETMIAADRSETHMGWGSVLRVDLDELRITAAFPDCEASLQFHDFNPRYDYMKLVGIEMPEGHGGHHFEVAGKMTGKLRIGDRNFEINGLGYRDRSWGPRNWGGMRSTRWWPVVFGPDLCLHSLGSVLEQGFHSCHGYVMRDGVPQVMTDIDMAVTLDYDAIGPRSGVVRFTLDNGETGEIVHQRSDGIVLHVRGYTAVESVGTATWGDRVGFSNLEVCTNPAGGSEPPIWTLAANNSQGLSQR